MYTVLVLSIYCLKLVQNLIISVLKAYKSYSGLQKNSPFANFEKISVAVVWVNIKVWTILNTSFESTYRYL